jgi:hypothetical protein
VRETGPKGPVLIGVTAFLMVFAILLGIVCVAQLVRG